MKFKYITLVLLTLGFIACESDDEGTVTEEPAVALTTGSADVSNYVAVGASFTAGFTDNALFIAAQENSFPNTIAQQFAVAGGGEFTQPLMNDNVGGLLLGGVQIANPRLFFNGAGPAVLEGTPTTEVSNILSGSFRNMGVPGAKSFHLLAPGYGNVAGVPVGTANPYFARMASNPNATILEDAVAQSPTFFTLSEIGGNDVLGFATSGGSGVDQTGNPDPSTYGPADITDPTTAGQLAVNGITFPMEDQWVLTATETSAVITATDAYNATIQSIASSANLALVDLNAILQEASTTGIVFDDFTLTTDLVFGGLVSLDGVHLTARGYALMANKFLEAIDATYGSNFIEAGQVAKANDYPVAYSPDLQ